MSRKILGLIALCSALATAGSAKADLVVNGGFEMGDLTGWTSTGGNSVTNNPAFVHSGSYGLSYGAVGSPSFLYQDIASVAGQDYTFSFYQKTLAGTPNEFEAFFDGVKLLDLVNSPIASDFTYYSFNVVATSSSTEIRFGLRQDPAYSALDDVSVTPSAVPEPASLLGYGWRRRRRLR
jgi:hypothetical protein